ncbi:sugar phosphate isomerase/epimerase family protein [Paenibacillus dakarensis]|uniref:sugar phosphate isomerase/epimerase family protein n=1 Tax=Paenibacillus dakarensis TaxID=1527293 RepID=UPI000B02C3F8|nr:sugar phosphate isomerase/epimerase [Paenibacillus dakarensis]
MRRLQIGMWHQFSLDHWNEVTGEYIRGMELSQYQSKEAIKEAKKFCKSYDLKFGVHGPILNSYGYRLPKLNSPNPLEYAEALKQIETEVKLAAECGADYILFHYPWYPTFQPPFTPYPRLPDPLSRYESDQLSKAEFEDISERLFERLSEIQQQYRQRIVLEHDFFGDNEDVFTRAFLNHPDIQLVVDTARLDIAKRAFKGFDPYRFLGRLASQVYLVHYSNVVYEGNAFKHHLPVLPEQDEDERYGDSYAYLKYLAERNQDFHVTFEHDHRLIRKDQLHDEYRRVAELLGIHTASFQGM